MTVIRFSDVISSLTGVALLSAKRTSLCVNIPTSLPFSSFTGTPEILFCAINLSASSSVFSGCIVMGLSTMPDSKRFTRLTCAACSSGLILRCRIPSPPFCAMAIAIFASVTVSIAEERTGMFKRMDFVSCVLVSASLGWMEEAAGSNSTSSNVRPCLIFFWRRAMTQIPYV